MKLFDRIKSAGSSAFASLAGDAKNLTSVSDVNASLAIIALVAGADGEVEQAERKAGAEFVRKADLFAGHDRETLASTLEGYYGKSTNDILKGDLFDAIAKLKGSPDKARSAVRLGIGIANSDGEFEPQEKEILREVCSVLGLPSSDFRGLV